MFEESPLKYFRDQQKNPDRYAYGRPSSTDGAVFTGEDKEDQQDGLETKSPDKIFGPFGLSFQQTIELIKTTGLKEEFKDNVSELAIIENRRQAILGFLSKILEDVSHYISQINYLQIQKAASYDDINQYQSTIKHADDLRSKFHNKLITDLKITMRLININFNADFPEVDRIEEESKMPDRKNLTKEELKDILSQREYHHFPYPVGIFMDFSKAPKDPQGEREYIAHWAFQLYTSLSVLTSDIDHQ